MHWLDYPNILIGRVQRDTKTDAWVNWNGRDGNRLDGGIWEWCVMSTSIKLQHVVLEMCSVWKTILAHALQRVLFSDPFHAVGCDLLTKTLGRVWNLKKKIAGLFLGWGSILKFFFRVLQLCGNWQWPCQSPEDFVWNIKASGSSMLRELKSKIFLISIICCAEMSKKEDRNIANVAEIIRVPPSGFFGVEVVKLYNETVY